MESTQEEIQMEEIEKDIIAIEVALKTLKERLVDYENADDEMAAALVAGADEITDEEFAKAEYALKWAASAAEDIVNEADEIFETLIPFLQRKLKNQMEFSTY